MFVRRFFRILAFVIRSSPRPLLLPLLPPVKRPQFPNADQSFCSRPNTKKQPQPLWIPDTYGVLAVLNASESDPMKEKSKPTLPNRITDCCRSSRPAPEMKTPSTVAPNANSPST